MDGWESILFPGLAGHTAWRRRGRAAYKRQTCYHEHRSLGTEGEGRKANDLISAVISSSGCAHLISEGMLMGMRLAWAGG